MSRIVWSIVAPFCVVLAILAVVTIVRENSAEPAAAAESATADTVLMEGLKFAPADISVSRGTKVVFDNNDVAPHTVTADSGDTDSGIIDPGSAFTLVAEESFAYRCEIHPSMTAEIQVG